MELWLNQKQHVAWLSYLRVFLFKGQDRGVLKGVEGFKGGGGSLKGGVGLGSHFTNFNFSGS